jgi:hypothetical protein
VNRNTWTQNKLDLLAHFMQVGGQISRSSWMSTPFSLTDHGNSILESQLASVEAFVYAAVYFRQLYADDKLFSRVCDIYAKHVGNPLKVSWVKAAFAAFEQELVAPSFFFNDICLRDLSDAFLYGALVFHGPEKAYEKHKQRFQAMITQRSREELLYSLNVGMRSACSHAVAVSHLVYKELADWQNNRWISAPNVWWHSNLFESSPPSPTGNT